MSIFSSRVSPSQAVAFSFVFNLFVFINLLIATVFFHVKTVHVPRLDCWGVLAVHFHDADRHLVRVDNSIGDNYNLGLELHYQHINSDCITEKRGGIFYSNAEPFCFRFGFGTVSCLRT
jgi:hypothetical protein